jgi:hypothetical protein
LAFSQLKKLSKKLDKDNPTGQKIRNFKIQIDKFPHITKLQVNEIVVKDKTKMEKKTKSQKGGENVKK